MPSDRQGNQTGQSLVESVERDEFVNIVELRGGVMVSFYDPGPNTDWPRVVLNPREKWVNEIAAAGKEEMTDQFVAACEGKDYGDLEQSDVEVPEVKKVISELNFRASELSEVL